MDELASRLRAQPEGDLSLAVAAVALGIGAVVGYGRLPGPEFPLLLLLAVPCALLFTLALAPGGGGNQVGTGPDGRLAPWQTACLLVAIPLLALSLLQLVEVLGKEDPGTGTTTWILALTGLCAAMISVRLDSPGATVLTAATLAAAVLTGLDWVDSDADVAAFRDVLLIEGVIFFFLARSIWDARRPHAAQLVAVGGFVLIAGAVLGNTPNPFSILFGFDVQFEGKDGWTLVLIVVSIGALAFAAWQRHGGSAFVGLTGASLFGIFTGSGGDLSGWPLLLGLTALACISWALIVRPSRQSPPAGAGPPAQSPPT